MDSFLKFKISIDNFMVGMRRFTSSICARVNWLYVRLFLIVIGVISTAINSESSVHNIESITLIELLAVFIFCIVGLQLIIGIQAINSQSDNKWLKPTWHQNPFNLGQPAHFFHFGGWFMFLSSLPSVILVIDESQSF